MSDDAATSDREGVGVRCLLWLPPGYDAPLDLLDGLRQRRVPVREVHDAPAVMAELAAGWANVLVIVEPKVQRHGERLVEAVRRYFPRCVLWAYRFGDDPPLQRWAPAAFGDAAEPKAAVTDPGEAAAKVAGEQAEPSAHESSADKDHPPVTRVASEAGGTTPEPPKAAHEPEPTSEPAPSEPEEGDEEETDEEGPLLTEAELEMLLGDEAPPARRKH